MSYTVAIAGKGGSGKTTTAALIIRYFLRRGLRPVLAIDADGNANLHESLGLDLGATIGATVAGFNEEKIDLPSGLDKTVYLEMMLSQALVESAGMDLISMGRGAGDGCYCYPNTVLKQFIDRLKPNYPYLVMDNEAGLEHLSRRTTENINDLLIISDHSVKGVRTMERIRSLVSELKLDIQRVATIVARVPGGDINAQIKNELEALGVCPIAVIPNDEAVIQADLERRSLLELPDTSEAVCAVAALMDKLAPESMA
ncbi:MAG: AAA family ATPase [Dehalococcoidia bacterium]|nr:AAA family ATPase [Dehalococcoidia bacterium]